MYKKVDTSLNFAERELNTLKFWKENKIFEKSVKLRDGGPVFTFYDGPPTANGIPHIGHVITRSVKDVIPRYRTMKGYNVTRKAGWDTHGLPVELEVERSLGISGKPDIEKYGVEPFINKCKESVWRYKQQWEDMSDRVGFWADMEDPYVTYHNNYIESVWWALKQIWEKGLIYKGHKVVPYCPRCGTALSSHEVAQGYHDVKEESAYVKFKRKGFEKEYFLAWTTTPWTLPSNVALAVNAREDYSRVRCGDEIYIMATALLGNVLPENYETLETMKGAELEKMEYEPLFDGFYSADKKCCYIVCDDYVSLTDGVGIVHIAPAFGEDDARIGNKYDLPFVQLVDEQGNFVESVKPWAGMFVKQADPLIIQNLRDTSKLYKTASYEHSYPFCWRCDTALLYYARDTWFIRMTAVRDKLVANNNSINWLPENVKTGRFGNFLENVMDWALSRERYWGTPLPIWECGCGHRHMVGSVEELTGMSDNVSKDIELHKPYIDDVILNCPECGGKMKRVTEVIDCWFDAGSMPFAQWHYPFENQEKFKDNFPADFISEAEDQTRGWFYALIAISTLLFDAPSFENVIMLGLVQDKHGIKMSKHKNNGVDPWDFLNKQGADAVRWYFYTNSSPWLPSRFYEEAVNEYQRKFMGTLWNTYAFYVLYGNIDKFNPMEYKLEHDKLPPMDKWILSKLNTLVKYVDECLDNYRLTEPSRALNDFVDDLSNWYVRRCRERFWVGEMPQDKINAYMTLYTVLVTVAKLSAVFVPFISEEMYQNLVAGIDTSAPESVHLCDFPAADESLVDKTLEENMDFVLNIVKQGRAARNNANIKNRQPISSMYVKSENVLPAMYVDIVAEELNVKKIIFANEVEGFTTYKFKPQLRTLGPKYGKLLPKISKILAEADGNELYSKIKSGTVNYEIDGITVELTEADVLIEASQKEGYMAETEDGVTVVIDTNLTDELIEEGFVREIISKLQTMRKDAGFEVTDRINVSYGDNAKIAEVMAGNAVEIMADVLADNLKQGEVEGYSMQWNINGEQVLLGVKKV